MKKKPNIVFIMADQFRFDAIARHGNKLISTPTLDQWIANGFDFVNAYSATPTCVPARATLLSGLSQTSTGIVGYQEGANWNFPNKLGEAFAKRGYYAKAIGKMHVNPPRNRMGFHHVELHDGYLHQTRKSNLKVEDSYQYSDDYLAFIKEQLGSNVDFIDYGLECNSWVSRPFPFDEKYHPTNWVITRAIDFLRTRDKEEAFFLKISFVRPHSPLDPPKYYFEMYLDLLKDLSENDIYKWTKSLGLDNLVSSIDALEGKLPMHEYRRMLAGYFGLVTQIDHQINRFMMAMGEHGLLNNTIFIFTSDHGDQLGDHNLFRKGFAYQSSVHIPLIVYDPGECLMPHASRKSKIEEIVELRDILPSLIDFATGEKLLRVDGKSFKSLMINEENYHKWRNYLHGEHILGKFSNQYIIRLPYKYIWYTQTGDESLFNIDEDPNEIMDLIEDGKFLHIKDELKSLLINELKNRPEGFVENAELICVKEQKTLLPINEKYRRGHDVD